MFAQKPSRDFRTKLVDRWQEEDYTLAVYSDDDPNGEIFSLWVERDGHEPFNVTADIDAYCRRIQNLVNKPTSEHNP